MRTILGCVRGRSRVRAAVAPRSERSLRGRSVCPRATRTANTTHYTRQTSGDFICLPRPGPSRAQPSVHARTLYSIYVPRTAQLLLFDLPYPDASPSLSRPLHRSPTFPAALLLTDWPGPIRTLSAVPIPILSRACTTSIPSGSPATAYGGLISLTSYRNIRACKRWLIRLGYSPQLPLTKISFLLLLPFSFSLVLYLRFGQISVYQLFLPPQRH